MVDLGIFVARWKEQQKDEVVMSPQDVSKDPKTVDFQVSEEVWFSDDRGRESKRPLRTSPTTPPPPIGDDIADRWFR